MTGAPLDSPRATAAAQARATGKAVPVPTLTDEYSTTVANPDGSFTLRSAVTPQRVKKSGVWTAVDPTLIANPDGTISARATLNPVTVSGGGTGTPLMRLTNGPAQLAYTWPGALPTPELFGATATYRNVYPGVDLKVTVDVSGGAEETLVVANAAAAANPALRHIRLGVHTSGLTLRTGADGTTQGVSADGKVLFASGDARMWDSTSTVVPRGAAATPSTAFAPGRGARTARVGQTITSAAADITPDASMLASTALKFPLYIDPDVTDSPSTAYHFNQLTQADPGTEATFDRAQPSGEGIGYQGDYFGGSTGGGANASGDQCPCGIDRSDFQMGVPSTIWGATIQHAYLQAHARFESDQYTHSETLSLYSTCTLAYGQRWNVPPCIDATMNPFYPSPVDTFDLSTPVQSPPTHYPSQSIQIGNENSGDWHFTAAMQRVATNHISSWAVELRGDETNAYNFIRVDQTSIYFVIQYDFPPDAPSGLTSSPLPHNGDGSAPASCVDNGWLGIANGTALTTTATVNTRTGATTLTNATTLKDTTANTTATSSTVIAADKHSQPVSAQFTGLHDGDHYSWWTTSTSNALNGYAGQSTSSATCSFGTDFDPPSGLVVTSSDYPINGAGTSRLYPGQAGQFTLGAADTAPAGGTASGLWCYGYAMDATVSTPANNTVCTAHTGSNSGVVMAGSDGKAQITLTPPSYGTHSVSLYAIDRAGNTAGTTQTFAFYVPENPKATPSPGDVTGDGVPDLLLPNADGNLRAYQMGVDPSLGGAIAALKADAPPTATGWNDSRLSISARGSMHGLYVDDLLVHLRGSATTYIYHNDGAGHFPATGRTVLTLPPCSACGNGYPADGTWTDLLSITAIGDGDHGAVGAYQGSGIGSDPEDFVAVLSDGTKQHLWLFQQATANAVNPPILLSNPAADTSSSWTAPLFSPGDATGDGMPDVWTRDASGNLLEYASAKKADGSVDWAGLGGGHGTKTIDTGLTAATYPVLSSAGDLTGDGQPDLWGTGTAAGGELLVWAGTSQSSGSAPYFTAASVLSSGSAYATATPASPPVLAYVFGNVRYSDGSSDLVTVGGVATSDNNTATTPANAGTLSGGVTAAPGHDGADVHFNGTSGVVTSASHVVDTSGSYSVSVWVNPAGGTTGTRTAVSESGTTTSQFALGYDSGTGRWAFTVAGTDAAGPAFTRSVATAAATFGTWTHLVGVYDAGPKTIQLYVNGAAQGSAVSYTSAWNATGVLLVGADKRGAATSDWWSGDVDDLQVYNRTMGSSEIGQLYNNQRSLLLKPITTTTVPASVNPATTGCSPTGPYGVVTPTAANPSPALDATVSDTDPTVVAGADFAIWDETTGQAVGGSGWFTGTQFGGGASHEYRYTPALTSGHRYAWYARTNDGSSTSPPSDVCHFSYSVPFGLWPASTTPANVDSGDGGSIEVGVRFQVNQASVVSGIAFYKASTNTGTHTGTLWTDAGQLVATGTFTGETASGWQTLTFASPVFIPAHTTYMASYYAPNGHYSYDTGTFAAGPVTNTDASGLQVTALQYGATGPNGLFHYGSSGFPSTDAGAADNYWVEPLIRLGSDNGPHVLSAQPAGSGADPTYPGISVSFEAPIDPATLSFSLTSSSGAVPGTAAYDGAEVTFTPRDQLVAGVTYTGSVSVSDPAGNAMPSPYTWTFTVNPATPDYSSCTYSSCGLWDIYSVMPGNLDFAGDSSAYELGMRFTTAVPAQVTGIAFYKGSGNTGTHTGSLWRADGTLLATGTFTGETDSGWQTLTFDTPVAIVAGTTYIASYYDPNGNYAVDIGYFASPQLNYPLTAPAGTNGVFRSGTGGGFPATTSSNQTNYWVQPLFTAS